MMERVEDSVAAMEDNFAKALKRIEWRLESLETSIYQLSAKRVMPAT